MKRVVVAVVALTGLALGGCSGKGETKKAEAVKPPVAVDVAAAAPRDLTEGIDVTGELQPKFAADVKTQIPGLVKEVFVTQWVRVRKGQPLARIDVAETEAIAKKAEASVESARASLAQAQVSATRAERERERMQKLKESGLATQQQVDDSLTEAAAAQTRIDAARAQVRAAQEEVRQARARAGKGLVVSPMDGVVALREVNVGDLAGDAAAAKPIFRVVDNRVLNLTVTVPSVESARVKNGQPLEFAVDAFPGKTFTGKVMFVNPELNAADRSLKVVAEVQNPDGLLKGGLFTKGRIVTGSRRNVIQVPRAALSSWDSGSGKGSLLVVSGGVARVRPVTTGAVAGDQVEVAGGLAQGEQYVVRGGFDVKDGDRVSVAGK